MPISFSAVDGFKKEGGTRRAVATWYMLLLERPIGAKVFYIPFLVVCVLAALEWRLALFARKGQRKSDARKPRARKEKSRHG
jgi:hypothetical protein